LDRRLFGVDLVPFIRQWGQFFKLTNLPGQTLTLALQRILRCHACAQMSLGLAAIAATTRPRLAVMILGIGIQQAAHGIRRVRLCQACWP
jgi:hypothetical protein